MTNDIQSNWTFKIPEEAEEDWVLYGLFRPIIGSLKNMTI
jgi:hypothetical protein